MRCLSKMYTPVVQWASGYIKAQTVETSHYMLCSSYSVAKSGKSGIMYRGRTAMHTVCSH